MEIKLKTENGKLKSMVSATHTKLKGENGKLKSEVSATRVYKVKEKFGNLRRLVSLKRCL